MKENRSFPKKNRVWLQCRCYRMPLTYRFMCAPYSEVKNIRFVTTLGLINCHQQIKYIKRIAPPVRTYIWVTVQYKYHGYYLDYLDVETDRQGSTKLKDFGVKLSFNPLILLRFCRPIMHDEGRCTPPPPPPPQKPTPQKGAGGERVGPRGGRGP